MDKTIEAHEENFDPQDRRDYIDCFLEEHIKNTPSFEVSIQKLVTQTKDSLNDNGIKWTILIRNPLDRISA